MLPPAAGREGQGVSEPYDIFIIGGGINGCGIARDAAGRGFTVFLAEKDDLASGTSSWSTKLIHGGLRYLEHYAFRLVREALIERERLWANAPHIVRPLRFVLPHHRGLRPAWLLRLGLFLYDHLGGRRRLPPTRMLDLARDPAGAPLQPAYTRGFEYSDCWVDDARLVVLNARDAADRGAAIRTRTEVTGARRDGALWRVAIRDRQDGAEAEVTARFLVNAAGPWVDLVLGTLGGGEAAGGLRRSHNVRLVQGSHIVLPRLFDHDRAYIFQNSDGRIVFAIPYEGGFTLVGTTDRDLEGDPGAAAITPEEREYLCTAASAYFRQPVRPEDIVWSFAGVRPLYDDGATRAQEATRDYVLRRDGAARGDGAGGNGAGGSGAGQAPLLNVFGGKLTTYRKLAEAALHQVEAELGRRQGPWTRTVALPGGDFPVDGLDALAEGLRRDYPFLSQAHAARLARLYGTCARAVLGKASQAADLGPRLGGDLFEGELRYLIAREWACTATDVLWRRTKLGLHLTPAEAASVEVAIARLRDSIGRDGASQDVAGGISGGLPAGPRPGSPHTLM